MELITDNHAKVINDLIVDSNKIILCSGWLNKLGIDKIYKNLVKAAKLNTTIHIYSNTKHTTNSAKKLISSCKEIKHLCVSNKYLHSKIYYFEYEKTFAAIIGSANMTKGGFGDNLELSVLIKGKKDSTEHRDITAYIKRLETQ